MSDTKISALPSATTPLAGTEVVPLVQSATTKNVSVTNLTAGRDVSVSRLAVGQASPSYVIDVTTGNVSGSKLFKFTGATAGGSLFGYSDSGGVGITRTDPYNTMVYLTTGNTIEFYSSSTLRGSIDTNWTISTGNIVAGTAGKGFTTSGSFALGLGTNGSTSQVTINSDSSVSAITGSFNNVGTAQTITINDTNGGYVVITGVQGGVGSSTWTLPFVKRSGSLAIGTASKAILTADPISSVTVSSNNISVTPLAANTYITFAIYYTPLGA